MRKFYFTTVIFLSILFFISCGVSEKVQIENNIKELLPPVPPSFSSTDSAKLIENWTIGIKFYKSSCASCHGIFGKGKDSIPNFSKQQMDDYKTTFLAGDKKNHAVMSKMTENDLDNVLLFLTDIKHSDIKQK